MTRKEESKMQAKKCNENNDERFICEKGNKLNLLLRSEVKDCSDETLLFGKVVNTKGDLYQILKTRILLSSIDEEI